MAMTRMGIWPGPAAKQMLQPCVQHVTRNLRPLDTAVQNIPRSHDAKKHLLTTKAASIRAGNSNSSFGASNVADDDVLVADRALAILGGDVDESSYYVGWEEAQNNAYDAEKNPRGCIQLGLSENKLSLHLLDKWFSSHDTAPSPELENILNFKAIAGYPDVYHGLSVFRSLLASFMNEVFGGGVDFNADQIVVTTGATAAIELLVFCLADPGDVFLIPAPYYPGFNRDINFRTQVSLLPVQCSSENNFLVSKKDLEQAYSDIRSTGQKVKGIIMTSPANPLGVTYSEEHLLMILEFIREKGLHLICDEIYGGSVFGSSKFVSMAELLVSHPSDSGRVHIVYGLSKILCIPGFRVGVLYSWNEQVLSTVTKLCRFSSVSTQTQQVLVSLLSDKQFLNSYIAENQRRLSERWRVVRRGLQEAGLESVECTSGFYCWADLRNLLSQDSREAELDLWRKLLYEVGVNITPGSACRCNEPGWFRVCFAFVDDETMAVALDRIRQFSASIERDKQSKLKACIGKKL